MARCIRKRKSLKKRSSNQSYARLLNLVVAEQTTKKRGGHHNKGMKLPPSPPTVEEIVQILNACQPINSGRAAHLHALRLRTMIIVLWRAGLRCQELLDLEPRDLVAQDRAIVIRKGKGGRRRVVAIDKFGWDALMLWMDVRVTLPTGPVFCAIRQSVAGKPLFSCDIRRQFKAIVKKADLSIRFHPHGLRHACAIEMWREGIPLNVISKQLGHARLDVTDIYLTKLAPVELLEPIGNRRPPMMLVPLK